MSLHALPLEIVYRILDKLGDHDLFFSVSNIYQ